MLWALIQLPVFIVIDSKRSTKQRSVWPLRLPLPRPVHIVRQDVIVSFSAATGSEKYTGMLGDNVVACGPFQAWPPLAITRKMVAEMFHRETVAAIG